MKMIYPDGLGINADYISRISVEQVDGAFAVQATMQEREKIVLFYSDKVLEATDYFNAITDFLDEGNCFYTMDWSGDNV